MALGPALSWGSELMSVKHGGRAQLFKSAKMYSNPEPTLVNYLTRDKTSNLFEPVSYLYKKRTPAPLVMVR